MAESSQSPPRRRTKVHISAASPALRGSPLTSQSGARRTPEADEIVDRAPSERGGGVLQIALLPALGQFALEELDIGDDVAHPLAGIAGQLLGEIAQHLGRHQRPQPRQLARAPGLLHHGVDRLAFPRAFPARQGNAGKDRYPAAKSAGPLPIILSRSYIYPSVCPLSGSAQQGSVFPCQALGRETAGKFARRRLVPVPAAPIVPSYPAGPLRQPRATHTPRS